jgi:large subunit ribosomal protein L29
MKAKEVREKSIDELSGLIKELSVERFRLKIQQATSELEKTHKLREVRRDVARAKTVLSEKQRLVQ